MENESTYHFDANRLNGRYARKMPYDGDKVTPERKCYCRGCSTYFLSTGDFDVHRVGVGRDRCCQTSYQRSDANLWLKDGYWGRRLAFEWK